MANTATLVIEFLADTSKADKALASQGKQAGKFQSAMKKAAIPAAAVAAGITAIGVQSVKAASDLQQAQGAVESVYGGAAKAVTKYAETSANRLGLARSEYLQYSSLVGAALQNAGFSAEQAANMSDKALGRAADLAATYGGTTAEAVEAINAAVSRGEYDPLEKYAISLNKTAVTAELAKRGQDKLTGAALKNATAQASLDLIYQNSSAAAGQFAKESDTAAGAQARASAAAKDAAADLGTALLPAVAAVTTQLAKMAGWMSNNTTTVQIFAGVIGGVAVAVLAINAAFKVYAAYTLAAAAAQTVMNSTMGTWIGVQALSVAGWIRSTAAIVANTAATVASTVAMKAASAAAKAWAAVQWVLNAAMTANPIGLIVVAIIALVAAFIIAYKKSDAFREIVNNAFASIMNVVRPVVDWLKKFVPAAFSFIVKAVGAYLRLYWKVVTTSFNIVRTVITTVINTIRKVVSAGWKFIAKIARTYVNTYKKVISAGFKLAQKAVSTSVNAVMKVVRGITGKVRSALSNLGGALKTVFTNAWKQATRAVTNAVNSIRDTIRSLPGKIRGLAGNFKSAGSAIINAFVNGMKSVGGIAGDMAGSIWNALKGLINSAINSINRALEFRINLPGPKDINVNPPNIPTLAEGGVTTGPTLAVIGDNPSGREAVIPLDKYDLGGATVVEVHIGGEYLGRFVEDKIRRSNTKEARRVLMKAAV